MGRGTGGEERVQSITILLHENEVFYGFVRSHTRYLSREVH